MSFVIDKQMSSLVDSKHEEFDRLSQLSLRDGCSVWWSPRRIEWFKINFGVDYLLHRVKASFSLSDRSPSLCLLSTLILAQALCADFEISRYFFCNKLHKLLAEVAVEDIDCCDAIEALMDKVLRHTADPPNTSPINPLLSYTFVNSVSTNPDISNSENTQSPTSSLYSSNTRIHLRLVNHSMHGHGQFSVGYIMWSSSVILTSWIFRNPSVFVGRTVLELGSGLGLSGIAAAGFAKSTVLSDFNNKVLETLDWNVRLNTSTSQSDADNTLDDDSVALEGYSAHICPASSAEVFHFDWNVIISHATSSVGPFSYCKCRDLGVHGIAHRLHLTDQIRGIYESGSKLDWNPDVVPPPSYASDPESGGKVDGSAPSAGELFPSISPDDVGHFDIVLGSDLICCDYDAILVANVVKQMLHRQGIAIFVLPQPQHRYGVELFIPAMLSAGFDVYWRPVVSRAAVRQYASAFPMSHEVFSGTYFNSNSNSNSSNSNSSNDIGVNDRCKWAASIDSIGSDLDVFDVNEDCLRGVEEKDYQGWDLIICRHRPSI